MRFAEVTTQRLYQRVAAQIAGMIRTGELPLGERLPAERELSLQLSVSRPVVREAMIALEIAGLVEIRTGSGIYVAQPQARPESMADPGLSVFDILAARYVIEGEVAFLAAASPARDCGPRLRQVIEAQEVAMRQDGSGHLHDRAFHAMLADATGSEALGRVVGSLWTDMFTPVFQRLGRTSDGPRKTRSTLDDHRRIVDAVVAGDADAARSAMHVHIDHTRDWFLEDRTP